MSGARVQPSDQFAADFKNLIRDVEEYKQFQRSGQDSVRMYRIFSEDAADVTYTDVMFNDTKFRLTFFPDSGAARGLVYKMEYAVTGDAVEVFSQRENVDNSDGSQSWIFIVSGSDFFPADVVNLKFYFWASGTGTFTIEDL